MSTQPTTPTTPAARIVEHTLLHRAGLVAERDYFSCPFCYERFATAAARSFHEEHACTEIDKPPARLAARELPTPFTVEVDSLLSQGTLYLMLRRSGLRLVDRGENRPYLLTFEPQSIATQSAQLELARAIVAAEAARITRERDAWSETPAEKLARLRRGEYTRAEVDAAINESMDAGREP